MQKVANIPGASRPWRSVRRGGFLDRHPILVPATTFLVAWVPYLVVFFRKTIAFGDLGGAFPAGSAAYGVLFILQLGVCVISHSLTLRTIIRLYAPRWLIFGSIAFFALSPTWGLLTAADIRHPLFAAVFCVFISSAVFVLYSRRTTTWVWVQLGGGALAVCLLRDDGLPAVAAGLGLIVIYELWKRWKEKKTGKQPCLAYLAPTPVKHRESRWSDVDAAFLVLVAVGLLSWLALSLAGGLPLGEPSFGAADGAAASGVATGASALPLGGNLAGTEDVAGVIPFDELAANSVLVPAAETVAHLFALQQRLPVVNLTFSWVAFDLLFAGFFLSAVTIMLHYRDGRPLIIAAPMVVVMAATLLVPADATLRFILPVLAAQPMLFASCFFSRRAFRAAEGSLMVAGTIPKDAPPLSHSAPLP